MGSRFDITLIANDSVQASKYIDIAINEISRIESLISSWDSNSETSLINENAGIKPVPVSKELMDLIERCITLSRLTDGAFDITFASMDKIWYFDGSMTRLPSQKDIDAAIQKIAYQDMLINKENNTIFLKKKGMKIGFGGIGKGYAADMAKKKLIDEGVTAGIINASGDLCTWGKQKNGQDWKVAITNPLNKAKAFALIPVVNGAVVTSGSYEKFVQFNGKRYSHIIDPRTGYPSQGIISVTVFAPQAELADALATSIFVMGIEVGINRINQLKKVECIIIDELGKVHTSDNIDISSYE
ncbi:FAD:protein FMN transferase [Marinilabiliaceae bacterium N1Y90]|nr:FAD:protein FMN transferase [Marinilabiliaceae bacterium N1Y90]